MLRLSLVDFIPQTSRPVGVPFKSIMSHSVLKCAALCGFSSECLNFYQEDDTCHLYGDVNSEAREDSDSCGPKLYSSAMINLARGTRLPHQFS